MCGVEANDQATLAEKVRHLEEIVRGLGSVLVAYSGGADSSYLLAVCADVLGSACVAVTAESVVYPAMELDRARRLAAEIGVEHVTFKHEHLKCEEFTANSSRRCYYCKHALFEKLGQIAAARDLQHVADGTVVDDLSDYRPGLEACRELGVRSPLLEAGLAKAQVRQLAHQRGLPTADLPSMACLASRIPYGQRISETKIRQVAEAEEYLRGLGLTQVRLRHHGDIARIEALAEQLSVLTSEPARSEVVQKLNSLGFKYCTLDLQGYRSGSMNEVLTEEGT